MDELKRCILIPAIKKNAVIPDQLVKKLAGVTLMQRALDTARAVAIGSDIIVVTDSQEITLICERNGVRFHYDASLLVKTPDIVQALQDILQNLSRQYEAVIIYRASCPLLTWVDIETAWQEFVHSAADCLVTVKSVRQRVWAEHGGTLEAFLSDASNMYVESKALLILAADALHKKTWKTVPYYLNDRAVEINSYQDWWICEKLLARRHLVFVVAGFPAIGMGHIFRALMLAQEIADHRITFMCTRQSELAAASIAAKDYRTHVQQGDTLAAEVLALHPDLVVNDILDTDALYISSLKAAGVAVVNFEDEGSGAPLADLVINALYDAPQETAGQHSHILWGHTYFCLRDEFANGVQNIFRPTLKTILVTFGGTDFSDFTRQTLDIIEPMCRARGICIRVVSGPGYAHRDAMEAHIQALDTPLVQFTHATNVMSRMMEGADLAICSAGRTVYELAHMRVPAIVLAHHEREARHTFARACNGFVYLGVMRSFHSTRLLKAFEKMLDTDYRQKMFARMSRLSFIENKAGVVKKILQCLTVSCI